MLTRMKWERNTYTLLVGIKLVQSVWKAIWRFLKRPKIVLTYDLAIPFLVIYSKEYEPGYNKATCTHNVYCSTIHNSQAVETAHMLYNWWMD
jgi:hypothetical protein